MLLCLQVYGGQWSPEESEWIHIRSTLPSAAGKNINKQSSDLATQCNSSCKVDLFFFWPDAHSSLEALRRGQHSSRFTAEKCEEVRTNHVTPVFPDQLEWASRIFQWLCKRFHQLLFSLIVYYCSKMVKTFTLIWTAVSWNSDKHLAD